MVTVRSAIGLKPMGNYAAVKQECVFKDLCHISLKKQYSTALSIADTSKRVCSRQVNYVWFQSQNDAVPPTVNIHSKNVYIFS
jgi:hypothetical protein